MRKSLFLSLIFLSLALWSQDTKDPFDASTIKGRTWTNAVLGVTWEAPKGMETNAESQARLLRQDKKDAVARMREQERQRGLLISGVEELPEVSSTGGDIGHEGVNAGVTANGDIAPSSGFGGGRGRGRGGSGGDSGPEMTATRSYMVTARPLPQAQASAHDLLAAELDRFRNQPGIGDVQLAAAGPRFGGQEFAQADWTRRTESPAGKSATYSRVYLATRNGYALTFMFRADSKKGVDGMAKSMESLKFAQP
jgi:hypothetical protein